ncbi:MULTISPECIES: hypothetical protein [unclassified Photorhabdus]|uniref:hypothetical protein n=1 Tax=unclassified Photorhabdus TaxID=2620880 RepID=UPI000DCB9248|nr:MULTISPECIES: hypothetical protein [unclassified Photorhabdus]RAW64757.1 hypothetical protein CKY15_22595 [Photorhabdus sp. S7-51]RAW66248.1 hypothetical protein CKY14_22655 [Photorhabdus sp. S14-60]RAW71411.1 hypothetical protein CKY06_22650 [Photorhabdus sp. S15-56]
MMTDKEISSVESLKASFKSGVRLMPEAFSHLIDEAYRAYETIDGAQGDGPTAGLKRDGKGKLALNIHHSGGLNPHQGALALSLKPEGGLSFAGGGYLKLDADRQVQFADFFSLSRRERIEITRVLGLKRTMMTRIVSTTLSPEAREFFGYSVSLNAVGDRLAVGMNTKICIYTRRKSGEWNTSTPIVLESYQSDSSWDVSLNAAGDCLALANRFRQRVGVHMRANGVWNVRKPVWFPAPSRIEFFGLGVSLSAAGDCLVTGCEFKSALHSTFHMFTRTNGIWDSENPIKFPVPSSSYEFGKAVRLSAAGNCLAVHGYDDFTISTIYVYTRTNGIWDSENPIKFSHLEGQSSVFSKVFSLNAEGDRLAVGVGFYKSTNIVREVYLYTRTNGIWDRENPIKFSAPSSDVTYFGRAIELNDAGDRLAVGAASRVYVYTCLNNKWNIETPIEILDPSGNSDNLDSFGGAVGLNKAGTSLAVGVISMKIGSASEASAVYIFENVK